MKAKIIIIALTLILVLTGCSIDDRLSETEPVSNDTAAVTDENIVLDTTETETEDSVEPETEPEETIAEEPIDYKAIYAEFLSSLITNGENENVSFSLVSFDSAEIPYLVLESKIETDSSLSGYSYNDYYTIENDTVVRKFTTGGSRYLLYDSAKNTFFTPIDTLYGTSGCANRLYGYRLDDISKLAERPALDGFAISLESGIHDYYVRYEYRLDSEYRFNEYGAYLKEYFDYYKIDEDDTVSAEIFFGRMYEDLSGCVKAEFYELSNDNINGVFEGDFEITADAHELLENFWSEKTEFLTYFVDKETIE